jgi:hypothetical protein
MRDGKLIDDLLDAVQRAENGSRRRSSQNAAAQNCPVGRSATAEEKEANSESEQLP